MNRAELIEYCRYYNGEKECPPEESFPHYKDQSIDAGVVWAWYWEVEKGWVEAMLKYSELQQIALNHPDRDISWTDYYQAGFGDLDKDDGVPLAIKFNLFDRYNRGDYRANVRVFPKIYSYYKKFGLKEAKPFPTQVRP